MQVVLLTAYDHTFSEIGDIAAETMRPFAERMGYEFFIDRKIDAFPHHPAWGKVKSILSAFERGAEFVFWIDADALIVRRDRDIREVVDRNHDMWLAPHSSESATVDDDWLKNPAWTPHLNTGVMLFRNCEWSRDFLNRVWELRETKVAGWIFWEQSAILHLMGFNRIHGNGPDNMTEDFLHVGVISSEWNTRPGGIMTDDPIINHYAGFEPERRLRLMKLDAQDLEARIANPERRLSIAAIANLKIMLENKDIMIGHLRQNNSDLKGHARNLESELRHHLDKQARRRAFYPRNIVQKLRATIAGR